jgi:hypothetical protein
MLPYLSRLTLLVTLFLVGTFTVSATELPFTDVSPTDDYYADLVTLYERGVIPETPSKRFNPSSLINRDDFVSIVVGVGCKKCLTPTFDDIIKYNVLPFVDFKRDNPNFYCVSYAKEQGIVEGYIVGANGASKCENGDSFAQTPFCAANKITRIEAVAVLLRQAGLWNATLSLSNYERKLILPDVNESWYGYAQKGIQAGIIVQDKEGKIRPNENISKREFVRMAANIFRVNLCALRNPTFSGDANSTLTSELRILDAGAPFSVNTPVSTMSNPSISTYNFYGRTESPGGPFIYSWDFARVQDGARLSASGALLESFKLSGPGTWLVRLTLSDPKTGRTSISSASVEVRDGSPVPTDSIR